MAVKNLVWVGIHCCICDVQILHRLARLKSKHNIHKMDDDVHMQRHILIYFPSCTLHHVYESGSQQFYSKFVQSNFALIVSPMFCTSDSQAFTNIFVYHSKFFWQFVIILHQQCSIHKS